MKTLLAIAAIAALAGPAAAEQLSLGIGDHVYAEARDEYGPAGAGDCARFAAGQLADAFFVLTDRQAFGGPNACTFATITTPSRDWREVTQSCTDGNSKWTETFDVTFDAEGNATVILEDGHDYTLARCVGG